MKTTIFAKKKVTKEGKPFIVYVGKLMKKDGKLQTVTVKFREECGAPKEDQCPCNIEFDKADGNLADRTYIDNEGNERTAYTLWLSAWKFSDEPYVDHSLDEFE